MRLRDTARLDDCIVGACLEERESFEASFPLELEDSLSFFSRASRSRARISSTVEIVLDGLVVVSDDFLRFPKESCALARAPKEMLFRVDWMSSSSSSSSPSSTSSSSSSPESLSDCTVELVPRRKAEIDDRYVPYRPQPGRRHPRHLLILHLTDLYRLPLLLIQRLLHPIRQMPKALSRSLHLLAAAPERAG